MWNLFFKDSFFIPNCRLAKKIGLFSKKDKKGGGCKIMFSKQNKKMSLWHLFSINSSSMRPPSHKLVSCWCVFFFLPWTSSQLWFDSFTCFNLCTFNWTSGNLLEKTSESERNGCSLNLRRSCIKLDFWQKSHQCENRGRYDASTLWDNNTLALIYR